MLRRYLIFFDKDAPTLKFLADTNVLIKIIADTDVDILYQYFHFFPLGKKVFQIAFKL